MSTTVQSETLAPNRRITLWHVSIVLLVLGLLVSAYLSYEHLTGSESIICLGDSATFDCNTVNSSIYSKFMGIYVGYLGLFADIVMLGILLLERRISILRSNGVILVFAIALLGFLYHDFLTYVAFTRIGKLCIWCLAHHTIITLLLIITSIRLYRTLFAPAPDED